MKFERISLEQGLSQSAVETISQDSRGFMWFGTQQGLNRFDGYKLKVYMNDPLNSMSIKYNPVLSTMTDRNGRLWAALMQIISVSMIRRMTTSITLR